MGAVELVGGRVRVGDGKHLWPPRCGSRDQQSVLSLHLAGLPEEKIEAQLEVEDGRKLVPGLG